MFIERKSRRQLRCRFHTNEYLSQSFCFFGEYLTRRSRASARTSGSQSVSAALRIMAKANSHGACVNALNASSRRHADVLCSITRFKGSTPDSHPSGQGFGGLSHPRGQRPKISTPQEWETALSP